jgi:hypothetical protein
VRLAILDSGHSLGTKALFVFIGAVSRQPVLDAVKLVSDYLVASANPNGLGIRSFAPRICSYTVEL